MSATRADDRENELREIVAEIVEVDVKEVTSDADFVDDLGMDSMMALEIMAAIEKKYQVQVPEDYLGKIMNLESLVEMAENILSKKDQ